jgi:hypothetical protein
MIRALAFCLLLSSCALKGTPGPAGPAGPTGATGPAGAGAEVLDGGVVLASQSGTRLRLMTDVLTGTDGFRFVSPNGLAFDTQLQATCYWGVAVDGMTRCLPQPGSAWANAVTINVYSDAACTQPLFFAPYISDVTTQPSCLPSTPPPYVIMGDLGIQVPPATCGGTGPEVQHVFSVDQTGMSVQTFYSTAPTNSCAQYTCSDWISMERLTGKVMCTVFPGTEMAPSAFVQATRTTVMQ